MRVHLPNKKVLHLTAHREACNESGYGIGKSAAIA
jgi:hypothetical protein